MRKPYYSLAASHSNQWLNCSVSPRLAAEFRDDKDRPASEGLLAHRYAELYLQEATGKITTPAAVAEIETIKADDLYAKDMPRHVETYGEYVLENYNRLKSLRPETILNVEMKVSLDPIVPATKGYLDAVIISGNVVEITDFKYGFTKVDAQDNPQGMLYCLGVLNLLRFTHEIEYFKFSIVQPRINHISSATYSADHIERWAHKTVKPRAALAKAGGTVAVAGSWCAFCPARFNCDARAKLALDEVRSLLPAEPAELLTAQQVAYVLSEIEHCEGWLKDARKFLFKRLSAGEEVNQYKLVRSRSVRQWTDPKQVIKKLRSLKFKKSQYVNEKVFGIGDATDLLGVDGLEEHLGELIHRPEGRPTLADASDEREDYNLNVAFTAFDVIKETN